ncbi:glycosyltransferase family 1 protein [Bacteroides uniformis]|jgi:glycosyltransferase involved in cell wall biosynthesis|uniref:Glycosyltransferase family 1 protein n=1 Tax=Bacteroides uniformis TaxID=820 RepID=A0A3E4QWN2_BACUN|nr:glycosyltransferase family 1 protein [Bacteroides uniformis]RGL11318.1 glycosyltransferase family 1 protein [Bacteroides uniformis]
MIRVLQILHGLNRGGIETFLMNVYRHIDRNAVQFDFLVSVHYECHYTKEIISLGGHVYDIPARREGFFKRKKALRTFFKAHKEYQIIHQHASSLSDIMPLKAAKEAGIPMRIIHSHNTKEGGSILHKYIHWINRFFVRKYATDFYACSGLAARWMYGYRQYVSNDYVIIRNAIDISVFRFEKITRKRLRQEFGINESQLVIGNIGRFHPQKNHDFLLNVFARIQKKCPDAQLLLVGDGVLRSHIEKMIHDLNIEANVKLLGVRTDIPQLLSMFDVLFMPSLYEGLPVTIIEAQATGLTCVLSSVITSEVKVIDSLIFKSLEDNEEDWCDVVIQAACVGRSLHAGKLIAEAGYDIENVSKELENIYTVGVNK